MNAKKQGYQPKPGPKPKLPTTGSGVQSRAVAIRNTEATPAGAMQTIIALAKDKSFDADKMKAMIEIQTGMMATQARINYVDAFHAMQDVLPEITANNKIIIKKKDTDIVIQTTPYASHADINKVIKPILSAHGFTLNFTITTEADGRPTTTGVLSNRNGGHSQTSTMTLPLDTSGSKNNVQGFASAVSYAKRIITNGILNLTSRAPADADNDGNTISETIDDDQFQKLSVKLENVGADKVRFRSHFKIEDIKSLPRKQFDTAMKLLDQKAKKAAS